MSGIETPFYTISAANHSATLFRQVLQTFIVGTGVDTKGGNSSALQVVPGASGSGSVTINPGMVWVPGLGGSTNGFGTNASSQNGTYSAIPADFTSQGAYGGYVDAEVTQVLNANSTAYSRIDLIGIAIQDAQYTASAPNTAIIIYIPGTAAASPVAPSIPSSASAVTILGSIDVPSGFTTSSTVTSGMITDQRPILNIYTGQNPGLLLAPPTINSGTHTYTLTTTFGAVDTTNMTVGPFVCPASGAVTVRLQAQLGAPSDGNLQIWGLVLHNTSTQVGNSQCVFDGEPLSSIGTVVMTQGLDFEVTGLTPGTSYQFDWAAYGATSIVTGDATGDGQPGPASMKVFAA